MSQDFEPTPTYKQSKRSNKAWTSVVTTKTDPNGTVTQVSTIVPKLR